MLCLLGPPAFADKAGLRPLKLRPKALALLARLALTSEPQQRSVLAELLFAEAADPRDSLRWHLSYLGSRLPEGLAVDRLAASVRIPTDAGAFRIGAEQILNGVSPSEASETLALYRGDLCAGLSVTASADFHNWLYVEEDELRRLFRQAVLAFAARALADGQAAPALPPLERLTRIDPYLEEAHVLLVEATESAGETARARHAYDRYQRIVRTELHAQPRPELALRYERDRPAGRGLPLDELVPLRDITMHVVDWPGGEPTILGVHGSGGHAYWFTCLAEELAPEVRVVALDLRGHGFSDKPPSGYAVDDHVEDLLQLMAALALPRPILLGHSLGGSIAAFAAEAAGDRIGGLVLYDAVVGDRAFIESASFVLDEFGPTLDERFTSFDEYQIRFKDEPDLDSKWKHWLERADHMELAPLPDGTLRRRALRHALAAEWASVAELDSLAALSRVTAPVLVVHADAPWFGSPYLDVTTVHSQLAAARNSRLYVAHGQNHVDIVGRPSSGLVMTLRAFAQEIRAPSTASQAVSAGR